MKNNKTMNLTIRMTVMAMLTALSVVSLYVVPTRSLIAAAPFLEYDPADIPILIGAMLLGPSAGLLILFAVCLIQALTISASSGIIGFFMHFIASGVLVIVSSLIYHKKGKNIKSLIAGLILGSIAMTIVMIPLNLVFTGIFMHAGTKTVAAMLIPAIIPFNILKASINSAITFAVFAPASKILKKYLKV